MTGYSLTIKGGSGLGTPQTAYYKINSDIASASDYDGRVSPTAVVSGVSTFENVKKIAIYRGGTAIIARYNNVEYYANENGLAVIDIIADGEITIWHTK